MTQLVLLHLASRDWVGYIEGGDGYRLLVALVFTGAFILSLGGFTELRLFRLVLGRSSFKAARWIALAALIMPNKCFHFIGM